MEILGIGIGVKKSVIAQVCTALASILFIPVLEKGYKLLIEGERKIVKFAFQSQFFTHFHHSPFLGGDGCVPCMQMTQGRIIISSFLQYSMELFFSFLHRVFRNNYRRPYTVEPILSLEYLNSIFKKTLFPCMIILFQDLFRFVTYLVPSGHCPPCMITFLPEPMSLPFS